MAGNIEKKLAALGITLPAAMPPSANYVPNVRTGNLLICSGQVSATPGGEFIKGKLGAETSPADDYENTERDARVDAAVNALPAKLRAVIVMHYLHDQSHQDMAKALGVTTSATRKYVGQALQLCRRRLRSTP